MCFPSVPILVPDIEKILKWLDGDLGIADKIESTYKSKLADSTNVDKFKKIVSKPSESDSGLKSMEKTMVRSMLESQKPYIEIAKILLEVLVNGEDIMAKFLGMPNPCYLPCTTSNKKRKNSAALSQLDSLTTEIKKEPHNDTINIPPGVFSRPGELPSLIYFGYYDKLGVTVNPPTDITSTKSWFGQFDIITSEKQILFKRTLAINNVFKGQPEYIKSMQHRVLEGLDDNVKMEWDLKSNYKIDDEPSIRGNKLFISYINFCKKNGINITNFNSVLISNEDFNTSNVDRKNKLTNLLDTLLINIPNEYAEFAHIFYKRFYDPKIVKVDSLNNINVNNSLGGDTKAGNKNIRVSSSLNNVNTNVNNKNTNNTLNGDSLESETRLIYDPNDIVVTALDEKTKFNTEGSLNYTDKYINVTKKLNLKNDYKSQQSLENKDKSVFLDENSFTNSKGELKVDNEGNPIYPPGIKINPTEFLLNPDDYDIHFEFRNGGRNVLVYGTIKDFSGGSLSSIKKSISCGVPQYITPFSIPLAFISLVSFLLPSIIDIIKIITDTLSLLLNPTKIIDFLVNIIKVKLVGNFEIFKPDAVNKKAKRTNDDGTEEDSDTNKYVNEGTYLLAGAAFLNLGFIKMALEVDNKIDFKTHYGDDADKFNPDNGGKTQPILKMILQMVSMPIKMVIDTFTELIKILKMMMSPAGVVEALPKFLSFKWLLDILNPFKLLSKIGFSEILCLLGLPFDKSNSTPILPIPPMPNLNDLTYSRFGGDPPFTGSISNLNIFNKCKKDSSNNINIDNVIDPNNVDNTIANLNNSNNPSLNMIGNINNVKNENLAISDSKLLKVNRGNSTTIIPGHTEFTDIIITESSSTNKFINSGELVYEDKITPDRIINNNINTVSKAPTIPVESKPKEITNTKNSDLLDLLKKNGYKFPNSIINAANPEKPVFFEIPKVENNLETNNLETNGISFPPALEGSMIPLNILKSLTGMIDMIIDLVNEFLTMPLAILGLDFLASAIPKIPHMTDNISSHQESIRNNIDPNWKNKYTDNENQINTNT